MIWYMIRYDMTWHDMIYDKIWHYMIWYMIRYDMTWYMIWYGMIYDMIWYSMIWYDMIWYDMIWYDMIWYDMIHYVRKQRQSLFKILFLLASWCETNYKMFAARNTPGVCDMLLSLDINWGFPPPQNMYLFNSSTQYLKATTLDVQLLVMPQCVLHT